MMAVLGRCRTEVFRPRSTSKPAFVAASASHASRQAKGRPRAYQHSGETLAQVPVLQHRLAEMWTAVEKTRLLVYRAAQLGDLGDPEALVSILTCKADVADTSVWVVNESMTLCGGIAYRENDQLARMLRDARASHVMSPTTDVLKTWAGRALLGLPLL